METTLGAVEDKSAQVKRQKETRILLVVFLLEAVILAPLLWIGNLQDKQIAQAATEYQQDCARPAKNSPSCQVLPVQVFEHKEEGLIDPDEEMHQWLGLQSKSGQRFEVDTYSPQWDRLSIGSPVTAIVWNEEVEEVSDSGGIQQTKSNPTRKAEDRRLSSVMMKFLALVGLVPLVLAGGNMLRGRQPLAAGNAGGG